jgi:hypothetical protein
MSFSNIYVLGKPRLKMTGRPGIVLVVKKYFELADTKW